MAESVVEQMKALSVTDSKEATRERKEVPAPTVPSSQKIKGTCKWFDSKKGYGYLIPGDGTPELFVHQSAIYARGFRSLRDGESVEFTVETDEQGRKKAANVTGPNNSFVLGSQRRFRRGPPRATTAEGGAPAGAPADGAPRRGRRGPRARPAPGPKAEAIGSAPAASA